VEEWAAAVEEVEEWVVAREVTKEEIYRDTFHTRCILQTPYLLHNNGNY
jgi:hypothetical protein